MYAGKAKTLKHHLNARHDPCPGKDYAFSAFPNNTTQGAFSSGAGEETKGCKLGTSTAGKSKETEEETKGK